MQMDRIKDEKRINNRWFNR